MSQTHPSSPVLARATRHLLAALLLAIVPAARADIVTITFDPGDPIGGLAAGAVLSNQYAAYGVTFTPNAFSGGGGPTGTWATNSNMTIVSSTGTDIGGLGTPSLVSGNILRSFNGWLGENGDPSFRATFLNPLISFSATFAGIASPASTRIFAYNGTTLLTTATASASGQQVLTVSGTAITSVVITPGDFFDWVGVDNLTMVTASAIPEPGPLALAAAGLPLFGLAAWRRRRAA